MASKDKNTQAHDKESAASEMIRRFKANPAIFIGTFIVLILVVVSFVLVPAIVPESRRAGGDLIFGYYDKVPISWVPGNYFAQYQERLSRYYQGSVDPGNFQFMAAIWRQAFESTAVHTAVLQEMKRSNYTIPVKTVDRQVARLPQFQENGRFSSALYQQMSERNRQALWRQMQDELTKERYFDEVLGLLKSGTEADFFGNMSSDMRKFDMVSFRVDAYPDSEYLAYALERPDLFKSIHLSRISVYSSEKEARQILKTVEDGTSTFEDAARAQSQDSFADRGGDMGIRHVFELEQEITEDADREKIINLGKGELSGVVRLGSAWAFFRVEDELKPANFEEETVMQKVRSYMRNFDLGRMEDWALAQAREFTAEVNAAGFDAAAASFDKTKSSFGPVSINYGSVDLFTSIDSFSIPELSGVSTNENFWKTAFSAELNAPSEPLVHGNNVLVFFPTEYAQRDESSVEGIASTFSSYWLNQVTEQSFQAYFINSPKMDDRFYETFYSIFRPSDY